MLAQQVIKKEAYVQNEYSRVVQRDGNKKAIQVIADVFEPCDIKWRGFPIIKKSGLKLKNKFEEYDARKKFEDDIEEIKNKEFIEPEGCKCGELLRGLAYPKECPLFGQACTPSSPVGPCMVSAEGSCNIDYRYVKKR